jgi:hypothetical protein
MAAPFANRPWASTGSPPKRAVRRMTCLPSIKIRQVSRELALGTPQRSRKANDSLSPALSRCSHRSRKRSPRQNSTISFRGRPPVTTSTEKTSSSSGRTNPARLGPAGVMRYSPARIEAGSGGRSRAGRPNSWVMIRAALARVVGRGRSLTQCDTRIRGSRTAAGPALAAAPMDRIPRRERGAAPAARR